ncbi:P-loop containing nucleoside triphosphate hydrolase protein [Pseudoneurospora amorphoporcata]|uniref:P-loop containing nucleoside triphosphate hydrolase protein n=1 Tax=Pseudoneurospora amorphoporcata TaxID=241081 RepID=A0AAN6SG50_9PEZI|nr:P-loop containing nucleoside triphosphate hydrolase protein [Pseudoneurospora amorphoporcata]
MPRSCSSSSSSASSLDSCYYLRPVVSSPFSRRSGGSVWILNQDSLQNMPANIQVMEATGCTNAEAVKLLKKTNGNIRKAIALLPGKDEWDFTLPRVKVPEKSSRAMGYGSDYNDGYGTLWQRYESTDEHDPEDLSLDKLVADIQRGVSCTEIRSQLTRYRERMGKEKTRQLLNGLVNGFPAFFYIVERRDAELVRMWAEYGGDVNTTYGKRRLPLVAYAIILGTSYATDTTALLKALLSVGASVACIPKAFYTPLERDLDDDPVTEGLGDLAGEHQKWCSPYAQKRVTDTLNFRFEQRYLLHRAALLERFSGAKQQVAKLHKAEALLGIHYYLVGQTAAITFVVDRLTSHLALQAERPMILLFAGPSGHGKTELARNLGKLISLDLHMTDCTSTRYVTDLWGPYFPYQGSKKGSVLNNFLAEHTAQPSIVFLDEFEKTDKEVWESLLKPFEEGITLNRRTLERLDCSKTIWILATNAFDHIIHNFCKEHGKTLFADEPGREGQKLIMKLSKTIQKESISKFGAPLSGRITEFVPFLTFSHSEQAAVADRFLASFGGEVIKPVKESTVSNMARLVGNIDIQVRRSYSVCRTLVTDGYTPELGARSIANTVNRDISVPVVKEYLDRREEIREDQGKCAFVVGVDEDGMIDVSEAFDMETMCTIN